MMAKFSLDLTEYAKRTGARMDTIVRGVVMGLAERIDERTPVGNPDIWQFPKSAPPGYAGGHARKNWQYKFGSAPTGEVEGIDAKGSRTAQNAILAGVRASPGAGVHYLANNVPYAERLENGWSHVQAPGGMVKLAVIDFQGIVRDEVARLSA